MVKTNYSVARVVTYTKQNIGKAERHNERKNTNYSNINVVSEQTKNNVYYKTCNTTYNERLKELVDENKISLRGLKDNAKVFDELVLDINSDYFEKHGGYNFANRQEYIGDTVNFRSTQRSFKDHTKIDLPKEKWKIFKNHHEPIIDEETWNTVQRIRNNKRRPTKKGKQSIFSGHLFCKDCGAKLYYCTANNFTADKDFYRCSNYKNNSTNACTSHNIRDIVLREIVLEQV